MATSSNSDPEDMRQRVLDWPSLFEQGFRAEATFPADYRKAKHIVFCAMGGSAIGAGLLGDYLAPNLGIPYVVHRDYGVPAFVGKETLVICVSHSGGTEETLSGYEAARERGAMVTAVTTGGELARRAKRDRAVLLQYESELQPRAAVPQVLGILLAAMISLKVTGDQEAPVQDALVHLKRVAKTASETTQHAAAGLAGRLTGKIPVIYGSGLTAEAARRLKGQISENAKQTAAWEVVPEQNHNAVVGFEFPEDLREHLVFVSLRTGHEHPRHSLRFECIDSILADRGLSGTHLHGTGPNRLSHLLTVVFLGDLASVLLAERNGVDPTPVAVITKLKKRLAEAS